MPLLTLNLTLSGQAVAVRRLNALAGRLSDFSPAWPEVIRVFRGIVARTFSTEGGSSDAGSWAPLAPSTQADRRRKGFGPAHPILRRTNRLYSSVAEDGADSIVIQDRTFLGIGSRVPYLPYHQSLAPRRKLPRRPVFAPTEDDKHELLRPLRQWATGYDATGRKQSGRA
jgi:hypothetical protein